MSRIGSMLKEGDGRKLLVPFLTAGFPGFDAMPDLIMAAADAGADIIELGVPFSDPMADGPAIQYSSHVALQKGATVSRIFQLVRSARRFSQIPIVLMGYYNPVHAHGLKQFVRQAADAGVDGFIFPDLPVDESDEFRQAVRQNGLSAIFLAAPTTSAKRLAMIDKACTDFVYAVTVTGVTGASGKNRFTARTDNYLKVLKGSLSKPFVAGFGVATPQDAIRLCRYADGVVIGSALVGLIRNSRTDAAAAREVSKLLQKIRRVI